ncbi:hypothetical protein [Dyella caseinilytica]|uniref:Vitamin K epoxide reductase family protein n=1 Tax=Dyella caseinilytica TaxID=1849581 RepID=A0ABX7GT72_9GAMM|nr:hypothetical protein [Dyella caseinilytica]QRN53248.1 hypothetical protein ISN74_17720 [Dyella caseinilytica]GGA12571.1 hypothetical protein GCM10011408_37680 [Dyella caseinilytica]
MTPKRLISILLPWLLIVVIGLLTAWLRYGFIEPPVLAHLCDDINNKPASCGVRTFIVLGFNSYGFGIAALVVTALALILKKPLIAWLAAALGMFAVIMYCYYAGALALLIGCLRLLRLQITRMAPPRHQHRDGDRQVHAKP